MNERLDNFKNQDKFRGIMKIGSESVPIASKAFYQAILININNFNQDKVDFPIQKFELKDQVSNIYFHNPFIIYNVILDNLKNPKYNDNIVLRNFAIFFTTDELEALKEICEGDEEMMEAYEKAEDLTHDVTFLAYYDYEESHQNSLKYAKKESEEIGLEKGIFKVAGELLKNNVPLAIISKSTNLSIKELEKLQESI